MLKLEKDKFDRMGEYESKYNLTREKFLKIFNLYSVLSFISLFKKIHSSFERPLADTPGADYSRLPEIKMAGIDFETL